MLVHDSSPMALISHEQSEQSTIRAIQMADNRTKANLHTAVKTYQLLLAVFSHQGYISKYMNRLWVNFKSKFYKEN